MSTCIVSGRDMTAITYLVPFRLEISYFIVLVDDQRRRLESAYGVQSFVNLSQDYRMILRSLHIC